MGTKFSSGGVTSPSNGLSGVGIEPHQVIDSASQHQGERVPRIDVAGVARAAPAAVAIVGKRWARDVVNGRDQASAFRFGKEVGNSIYFKAFNRKTIGRGIGIQTGANGSADTLEKGGVRMRTGLARQGDHGRRFHDPRRDGEQE
ncbi:hypothetical protein OY671_009184, partial [Metschnikowia pulcherrima]